MTLQFLKSGEEFLVNTETEGSQGTPAIAGFASDAFVVVWNDSSGTLGDGSGSSVKAQIFSAAGGKLGGEVLVNTWTSGSQYQPAVATLSSGGFVVSWTDFSATLGDASGTSVKAQIFSPGGAKDGGEFLVNTQTSNSQSAPTITGLAGGGFVVSWWDYSGTLGDASGASVKAQVFSSFGAKVGGEFLVNTATASDQFEPTITGLAGGGFVVSWSDFSATLGDASGGGLKAQVFSADGSRTGGEFLVNTQTAARQHQPTVAALANGDFVVSWNDSSETLGDASGPSVKAQIFTAAGAKNGGEFLVNTETLGNQYQPAVAGIANGGFVVSWSDFSATLGDASPASIKAQAFNAFGQKIGGEVLVNTQTGGGQYQPTVAAHASGGFVVSWYDESGTLGDASRSSIKAQIFAPVEVLTENKDVFTASPGDDTVDALGGNDVVNGITGDDTLYGRLGNDFLDGGEGSDSLYGHSGLDTLLGGAGDDRLFGGPDADVLVGGPGADLMDGGSGIDTVAYGREGGPLGVVVNLSGGSSQGSLSPDSAYDSFGDPDIVTNIRNVIGTAYGDVIYGGGHDNQLQGEDGDDALAGSGGDDMLDGGEGFDTAIFTGLRADYDVSRSEDGALLVADRRPDANGTDTVRNVERFTFADVTLGAAELLPPPNAAPVANNDTANVDEDGLVAITVLGNDLDPDGDALTLMSVGSSPDGRIDPNDDGTLTFTPNANFNGVASFDYTVSDGQGHESTASVTVTVLAVNDAPLGNPDIALPDGLEDTSYDVSFAQLLAGYSDADGDALQIANLSVLGADATPTLDGLRLTTPLNAHGVVTLVYDVTDGQGGVLAAQTKTVVFAPVNDVPDTRPTETIGGTEDTPVSFILPAAFDPDGNSLTYEIVPSFTLGGFVALDSVTRAVTFTPDPDHVGTARFAYRVQDGGALSSGTEIVNLVFAAVNDVPRNLAMTGGTVAENAANDGVVAVVSGVDPEGSALTYTLLDDAGGRFAIQPATGTVTVANGALLDYEAQASHTIRVRATDAQGAATDASFTVSLENLDEAGGLREMVVTATDVPSDGFGFGRYNDGVPGLDVPLSYKATTTGSFPPSEEGRWVGSFGGFKASSVGETVSMTQASNGEVSFTTAFGAMGLYDSAVNLGPASPVATVTIPRFAHTSVANVDSGSISPDGSYVQLHVRDAFGRFLDGLDRIRYVGSDVANGFDGTYLEIAIVADGGGGNDRLYGAHGQTNTLSGGSGDDHLEGHGINDVLDGGEGNDYVVDLDGYQGLYQQRFYDTDTLRGGAGNDQILSYGGGDRLEGGAGDDLIYASSVTPWDDVFVGGTGDDTIDGDGGVDTAFFAGLRSAYTVARVLQMGGQGPYEQIVVEGPDGRDVLRGIEILRFDDAVIDLRPVTIVGTSGDNTLRGTSGSDVMDGLAGRDLLLGFGGRDTLSGGEGSDRIDGGLEADLMIGGRGDDAYTVDDAGDVVIEAEGGGAADHVLSSVNFALGAFVEKLTLTGAAAIDGAGNELANAITGNEATNVLSGGGGNDALSGLGGADVLRGEGGSDALAGGLGDDRLEGGDGNDRLDGGAGADVMLGAAGNDTYLVDDAGDSVREDLVPGVDDGGVDTVSASITFTLGAFLENLTLTGALSVDGTGNGLANKINGNNADNVLRGGDGTDLLAGHDGADALYGDAGNDRLSGGRGADTMFGGAGSDTYVVDDASDIVREDGVVGVDDGGVDLVESSIDFTLGAFVESLTLTGTAAINGAGNELGNRITGNAAGNSLRGGQGADTLSGGGGNDRIEGEAGRDVLAGGSGADLFVFGVAASDSADRITDYVGGMDRIGISAADYGLSAGNGLAADGGLDPAWLIRVTGTGSLQATASHGQFVYNATTRTLSWDADGAGGAGAVAIVSFQRDVALGAQDILMI